MLKVLVLNLAGLLVAVVVVEMELVVDSLLAVMVVVDKVPTILIILLWQISKQDSVQLELEAVAVPVQTELRMMLAVVVVVSLLSDIKLLPLKLKKQLADL